MKVESDNPVVLVRQSVANGITVYWFADLWSAERNHVMMTSSNQGVSIHTRFLHWIPQAWLDEAIEVYKTLRDDPSHDVTYLATHEHSVTDNGPLTPVGR